MCLQRGSTTRKCIQQVTGQQRTRTYVICSSLFVEVVGALPLLFVSLIVCACVSECVFVSDCLFVRLFVCVCPSKFHALMCLSVIRCHIIWLYVFVYYFHVRQHNLNGMPTYCAASSRSVSTIMWILSLCACISPSAASSGKTNQRSARQTSSKEAAAQLVNQAHIELARCPVLEQSISLQ